jgi:putative glutamine amidotransferase
MPRSLIGNGPAALNASEPQAALRPLIGLSTYVEDARHGAWDELCALLPYSYVGAVAEAGGCPVLLPPSTVGAPDVLGAVDGLVLTGGPDVDPRLYGSRPHSETDSPREGRDAWEMALCSTALERDLPLLAICRGLQLLNVSLGGTLHQHLPEVLGRDAHRETLGRMRPNHVRLVPGSAVAAVLGAETEGLCHHHQGVDRLGERVRAVGFADDGSVEAIEVVDAGFAVGVQWHPEEETRDRRLFFALVEAARRRAVSRRASSPFRAGPGPVLVPPSAK